jgi:drug/metabolite transporter (DMT)-like permease
MIAILGGLGAAVCWATATLTSSRSSRIIGPASTVAWMMLVGLLAAAPLMVATGPLPELTSNVLFYAACSGIGSVLGLLLTYKALSIGKVGVVSSITSTEGAIAALLSVALGESLTLPVAATLCIIAGGIAIVAFATEEMAPVPDGPAVIVPEQPSGQSPVHDERLSIMLAIVAAGCFGISVFGTGQLGRTVSPFAAVMPARIAGVVGVAIPLALMGRLRLTRRTVPMVVAIGLLEVLGNASYALGAHQSVAIAAVMASQFAAIAAVAAYFVFQERVTPRQRAGIVAIVTGVAMLTLARA